MDKILIEGDCDVLKSIKVAQLSLKHRKDKHARQRIICFIGHPLKGTEEDFEDVGMMLKKNAVSIDVINFAHPDNVSRCQSLVASANQGQEENPTSHFMNVEPGCHMTDVILTSPICQIEDFGGSAMAGGGAGGMNDPLNIDPNMDPELAEAIRLSMAEINAAPVPEAQPEPAPAAGVQPGLQANDDDDNMYDDADEDKTLQEALALSNPNYKPEPAAKPEEVKEAAKPAPATTADVAMDEDFIKDVIDGMGIDVDADALKDLVDDGKKEGEKKDDGKDKEKK